MNILFLAHRVPYPPDKGDRIRSFHLLKHLARRARVYLACLSDEAAAGETVAVLRGYCERVAVVRQGPSRWPRAAAGFALGRTVSEGAFASPELRRTVADWARQARPHVALASSSAMAPYLRDGALRDVPAGIDVVDVDSQKWFDYAAASRGPSAWLYRAEGRRLRRLERGLLDWARAVTLVSEAEADLFRRCCGGGAVHAVTNGVDLDYFRPRPGAEQQACAFVGALDYRPNVEAACRFCRAVWPVLRGRFPRAKVYLVGRRPAADVRRLAGLPGVEVVGQVPDVRPWLARSAAAVVPLDIARGVQNKVLEALAMARPVVASPQALQGLRAEAGKHLLTASEPGQWADAVGRLFDDAALRARLGEAGRRYVEDNHRWERCLEPFDDLLGLTSAGPFVNTSEQSLAASS